MSRDSGSEQPGQRTVAELLAQHGGSGSSDRGTRRRRRRAEDPTETAPQSIINRVMSDSGQMRAVGADGNPVPPSTHRPQSSKSQAPAPVSPPHQAPPPQGPVTQGPVTQGPATPPPPSRPNAASVNGPGVAPPPGSAPTNVPPAHPTPAAPPPMPPAEVTGEPVPEAQEQQPPPRKNANFWAEKFAAARGSKRAAQAPAAPAKNDVESTVQQPALPRRPQPFPNTRDTPAPEAPFPERAQPEGQTEQFPPVHGAAQVHPVHPETPSPGPGEGANTAMMPYPDQDYGDPAPQAASPSYADPHGTGSYEVDPYADPYDFDSYDGAEADYREDDFGSTGSWDRIADERRGEDSKRDGDLEAPAGLSSASHSEYEADEDEFEESERSSGREWAVFIAQGIAALVAGGAVWFGFRWLWSEISVAALVAALAVTGVLVLVARRFVRNDDVQMMLLAVLVGLICTVSPAALLLIGQ